MSELPNIILETVASLNAMFPLTNRLIEISRDGQIFDDEIPDFASIQNTWRMFSGGRFPASVGGKDPLRGKDQQELLEQYQNE